MDKLVFRDNGRLWIKHMLRFLLKVFWVCPIKKKTVFFMANMGKNYLCSPKYLYESMLKDKRFDDYQYVWCFRNLNTMDTVSFSSRTIIVEKNNYIKFFYFLLTSEIVIYNCGGFSYAPIRSKQLLIETWHGGGAFKKVGLAIKNKSGASKKGIMLAMKDVKLFLSSCELSTQLLIREAMCYKGKVINSGLPRNDIFFKCNTKLIADVRKRLGLCEEDKVVLYAPTFKGDEKKATILSEGYEVLNPNIIKNALKTKYGGNWMFFTRGHQYTDGIKLDGSDGDLSAYPDMQELLLISDILITDYSSSIWDFALMKKPCYLFVPDINNFEKNERGFMVPFDIWPGIKVLSNQEFEKVISNFSYDAYIEKVEYYFSLCGSYETGEACEKVKSEIFSWVN